MGRRAGVRATGGGVFVVVLAAGMSTRFGRQKLLAEVGGEPLIRRTVRGLLSSPATVLVVTGADADGVTRALEGLPVRLVHNPDYAGGMGTSIAAGIGAAGDEAAAAVIALGDQPGVDGELIGRLIEAWREGDRPIVAVEYGGVQAPPVLFDRRLFQLLGELTGDEGARRIVATDPALVRVVAMEGPPPRDLDTQDDYRAMEGTSEIPD